MQIKRYNVYALYDKRSGAIRYIGVTLRRPKNRIREHLLGQTNKFVEQWIIGLRQMEGGNARQPRRPKSFGARILDSGNLKGSEWSSWKRAKEEVEQPWIDDAEAKGHPLLNGLSSKKELNGPVTFGGSLLPSSFRQAMYEKAEEKNVPPRQIIRSGVLQRVTDTVYLGSTSIIRGAFDRSRKTKIPPVRKKSDPKRRLR
jgi:hypothetical protein